MPNAFSFNLILSRFAALRLPADTIGAGIANSPDGTLAIVNAENTAPIMFSSAGVIGSGTATIAATAATAATIAGNNSAGMIGFTSSATAAVGNVAVTITLPYAYTAAPNVLLAAANANAVTTPGFYVDVGTVTTTSFAIKYAVVPVAATAFVFYYFVAK